MIGSVTKAFTATTVGELVAEGKMDWDMTPVNSYLPEFETIDPVLTSQLTMQDLLSHRTVRTSQNIVAPNLKKRPCHATITHRYPENSILVLFFFLLFCFSS